MLRRRALTMVLVCACGARSEIAGDGLDGGTTSDATALDVATKSDAPFGGKDGGTTAADAGCAAVSVSIGCAGPNGGDCDAYGCKFDVQVQCGGQDIRVGGSCAPSDGGSQGAYHGVCDENGKQTSTFDVPTTTCDCKDAVTLMKVVEEKCAHQ